MNRRFFPITGAVLAALGCLVAGYWWGTRRGEATVAAQRAALSGPGGLANELPARPAKPTQGEPDGRAAKPRSRDEMARILADLKAKMSLSAGGTGTLRLGLNDESAARSFESLSLDDVRTAMDLANEMPPGLERTGLSMALMQRWAQEDPMGALAYFESHREEAGSFGTLWLTAIVMPWLESDAPAAAREFARVLQNEKDDILQGSISNAVFMVAEKLRGSDPAAALGYVDSLPDWARDAARSAVAKEVHGDRRAEFLNRLRTLPDGPEKTAWQQAAASAMAPVDAPAASQWIDSLGLSEAARQDSTRAVFEKWMTHDPKSAVEWATARLPESDTPALRARTVESWAAREPNECGRWLGELPAGPERDPATAAFARAVATKDPDSAEAWAEQISDPQVRAACQEDIRKLAKR